MASLKTISIGPLALTATLTTNIANPPTAAGGVNCGSSSQYVIIRKYAVVNKTNGAVSFTLYKGATGANAAGTEIKYQQTVEAYKTYECFDGFRLDAADFLVGGASAATSLIFFATGECGVSG